VPADSPTAGETAGGLYLSFSYDATDIQSEIELPSPEDLWLYVVADGITALTSLEFGVSSTHPDGFGVGFEPAYPFNLPMKDGPQNVTVGAVFATGGPVLVGRFPYHYDGQPQVDFQIVPNSRSGTVRWGSSTLYEYHDFLEAGSASVLNSGTAVPGDNVATAAVYDLEQNYPNPFGLSTSIRFSLPAPCHVRLAVYDTRGRRIAVLADGYHGTGYFTEIWDGTDDAGRRVSPGIYFARMETDTFSDMRKMILLR
jgi:hypothetical protein